jgi:hypothetical protein
MIITDCNLLSGGADNTVPNWLVDLSDRHSEQFSSLARREAVVNFYDRWILPTILDLAMRQRQLEKYRREVVAAANGRVLEVGVGSG